MKDNGKVQRTTTKAQTHVGALTFQLIDAQDTIETLERENADLKEAINILKEQANKG